MNGTVYLIHFDRPYKHARHYIGWALGRDIDKRMAKHRSGTGARLLRVLKEQGIGWSVVQTWPDATRKVERKLKNRGACRICPVCTGKLELS